jgi:hypothetical protein
MEVIVGEAVNQYSPTIEARVGYAALAGVVSRHW